MTDHERLLDLLAARATEGLSEDEAREVERALRDRTDVDPEDLELATAAAHLAYDAAERQDEPMPAHLKQRILEQAQQHVASSGARDRSVTPFPQPKPRGPFSVRNLGWYAAAAMLLLALWAPWSGSPDLPAPAPSPTEQRALLIETGTDLIRVAWATPEIEGYEQVTGDVVWSNERQAGFMRLRGLPENRAAVEQYQLWIVDPSRDKHPIDGGVFDVVAGPDEEIVVPIDAKLDVNDPQVFAITLEQPGGVVVSDGPLLVVAPVKA